VTVGDHEEDVVIREGMLADNFPLLVPDDRTIGLLLFDLAEQNSERDHSSLLVALAVLIFTAALGYPNPQLSLVVAQFPDLISGFVDRVPALLEAAGTDPNQFLGHGHPLA
jgi:hypothetical protein